MNNTTDKRSAVGSTALFALASAWDAESNRLSAEANETWHPSNNRDLGHQAEVFRRCSGELQKLIRANAKCAATGSHGDDHE